MPRREHRERRARRGRKPPRAGDEETALGADSESGSDSGEDSGDVEGWLPPSRPWYHRCVPGPMFWLWIQDVRDLVLACAILMWLVPPLLVRHGWLREGWTWSRLFAAK